MAFPDNILRIDSVNIEVSDPTIRQFAIPEDGRDVVVIIGFAEGDAPTMEPMYVFSVEKTLEVIGRNNELARQLMTCWNAGGRSISIIKIGNTSELENLADLERHQLQFSRLEESMQVVRNMWYAGIIVPAGIEFEGYQEDRTKIDYVAMLANNTVEAQSDDLLLQVIVGTKSSDPTELLNSWVLVDKYDWQAQYCWTENAGGGWLPFNDRYRFVSAAAGRAKFYLSEFAEAFETDLAGTVAGLMSSLPEDVAISGRIITGAYLQQEPTKQQADDLSVVGFIPFGVTTTTRRAGRPEIRPLSDQNLSVHASDYQQNSIMRVARRVTMSLKRSFDTLIGSNGESLEETLIETLNNYVVDDRIKGFKYKIGFDPNEPYKRLVLVQLTPYFSVKAITLSVVAGPFS